METLYEKILVELVREFKIWTNESMEIVQKIGDGYSGAEVYIVELKERSEKKGFFFLKIDNDSREYDNIGKSFCFSKVAKCIERKKISEYYVLLLQIAGNSNKEYLSFYRTPQPYTRQKAVAKMVNELLTEGVNKDDVIRSDQLPGDLFRKHLGEKLKLDNNLAQYLKRTLTKSEITKISAIKFGGMILPNAFAYAVNDGLWDNHKLRNTTCCSHGDLHGNNVFISQRDIEYSLIDMSLYCTDGYVFYDTAYFELSILLDNLIKESMDVWLDCIRNISIEAWENLSFKDSKVINEIAKQESDWIKRINDDKYSYVDTLRESRLIARVLAGLNYAGKSSVDLEVRRKAFLFACCYLEQVLKIKKICFVRTDIAPSTWQDVCIGNLAKDQERGDFLNFASNFDETQRYILVLGERWDYPEEVAHNLTKVRWSGVISFRTEAGFENVQRSTQLVRYIDPMDMKTLELISKGGLWWVYANGLDAKPETKKESFAKWRNGYRRFFESFSERVETVLAPDDILLVIDWNSFSEISFDYLHKIFESLDTIENAEIEVAILDSNDSILIESEKYANLHVQKFQFSLEGIAEYCSQYMPGTEELNIYIPNKQNRMGTRLQKEDQQYIEQHVTLVYAELIKHDNSVNTNEKYAFFYGEPITWTAIDEGIYIERPQIEKYLELVRKNTGVYEKNDEKNQSVILIPHKPGAGATILCRVICWHLKDEYPTVVLKSKLNENVYECFQRLSSMSGKHLLILMDGDYNQNELNQLHIKLVGRKIKACVLYTQRIYGIETNETLSTLTYDEGVRFKREYAIKMRLLKSYSEDDFDKRMQNMERLSSIQGMVEFRLPFFYGMHAFEDDYMGINEYLKSTLEKMKNNLNMQKVINYMALISRYTEDKGLNFKYAKKLLGYPEKTGRKLLDRFREEFTSLIYISSSSYRICHPVIASQILVRQYQKFDSDTFKNLCINFIEDLKSCESGGLISEQLTELMMNIFITRDTEGDIKDNLRKKNFAQIILDISNPNLQEQVFEKLVDAMPENPYFRQHYGRLIIGNNSLLLDKAKEQFDYAIGLNSTDGINYHSRGNMYTKHMMFLALNNYKMETSTELYDKLSAYVDAAIEDYEYSIELNINNHNIADLVYPYASIIQTSTYIVNQLFKRSEYRGNIQKFMEQNNKMCQWCNNLITTAMIYDMDTEHRYDGIRDNTFYMNTRLYLLKYRYDQNELKDIIQKEPDNRNLKKAYICNFDSGRDDWAKRSSAELESIISYSEDLLENQNDYSEGVLWKWFNSLVYLESSQTKSYTKLLGILETLPDREKNLTVNYFLSMLYFCQYIELHDEKYVNQMQSCIELCRKLAGDSSNRTVTRYYYSGQGTIPLTLERLYASDFDGTVLKIDSNQSGYLTLDINHRIRAFFVPTHTTLKKGQEFNQRVSTKIGFSFDGLRAWEVTRPEAELNML